MAANLTLSPGASLDDSGIATIGTFSASFATLTIDGASFETPNTVSGYGEILLQNGGSAEVGGLATSSSLQIDVSDVSSKFEVGSYNLAVPGEFLVDYQSQVNGGSISAPTVSIVAFTRTDRREVSD